MGICQEYRCVNINEHVTYYFAFMKKNNSTGGCLVAQLDTTRQNQIGILPRLMYRKERHFKKVLLKILPLA